MDECDYCGKRGCTWQNHAEARADVAHWYSELVRVDEPFGTHVEV